MEQNGTVGDVLYGHSRCLCGFLFFLSILFMPHENATDGLFLDMHECCNLVALCSVEMSYMCRSICVFKVPVLRQLTSLSFKDWDFS